MNCGQDEVPNNTALCPIAFVSKSVSSAEQQCSNIELGALGILHSLEKFHHYCFAKEVNMITDQKQWVSMVSSDVLTLITVATVQNAAHALIQHVHVIQVWTRSMHSRLAIPSQSH